MSRIKGKRCYTKIVDQAYPIGIWIPPLPEYTPTQEEANRRYAEAADIGINFVNASFEYATPGALERCLAAASANGQKVMIGLPAGDTSGCISIVEETRNHPAVIGYTLKDEPQEDAFEELGRLKKTLEAYVLEDQFIMCNILPNYFTRWDDDPDPETGLTLYQHYVKAYMDIVKPDCLSLDHYPFSADPKNDTTCLRCFLKNFTDIRNLGLQYDVETWGFIQNSSWKGMREPNDNELRFVINMHLVFGIKQLSYFLYWDPFVTGSDRDEDGYEGMITHEGERTGIYDRVGRVNKDWLAMGNAYLDYDNAGFILTNIDEVFRENMEQSLLYDHFGPISAVESQQAIFSGCFDGAEEKTGLFMVNFNYSQDGNADAVVHLTGKKEVKVWGKQGLEQTFTGDSISLAFGPGEAKFLEIF